MYGEEEEMKYMCKNLHQTKVPFWATLSSLSSIPVLKGSQIKQRGILYIQVLIFCLLIPKMPLPNWLLAPYPEVACSFQLPVHTQGGKKEGHSPINQIYLLVDQAWKEDSLAKVTILLNLTLESYLEGCQSRSLQRWGRRSWQNLGGWGKIRVHEFKKLQLFGAQF